MVRSIGLQQLSCAGWMTYMTSILLEQTAPDFRPIPSTTDYTVSDTGLVISYRTSTPRVLKYRFDGSGRVTVSIAGKPVCVADLVRRVFGLNLCPRTLKPMTASLPLPSDLIEEAKERLLVKRQKRSQEPA